MHIVRWGVDGRARVFAGLDANNRAVMYVGDVLDTGAVARTTRVRLPENARPDGRPHFRVVSNPDGSRFSVFGNFGGFNTTDEREAVPLDSLLGGAEAMVFPAGGTIDPSVPIEPTGATDLTYGAQDVSTAFTFAPGGKLSC